MLIIRYHQWVLLLQCFIAFLLFFLTFRGTDSILAQLQYYLAFVWLLIAVFNLFRNRILVINNQEIMIKNAIGFNAYRFKLSDIDSVEVSENKIYINQRQVYRHSFLFSKSDFDKVSQFLSELSSDPNLKIHLIDSDES
jgi:hypothetical protein